MANSEADSLAVIYTLQIGRLFCAIGLLEQATVTLLFMIGSVSDGTVMMERHNDLRGSTFGRLVSKLEKAGVSGRSIAYLKNIKGLRNKIVHGFFWEMPFPGDDQIDKVWLEGTVEYLEKLHRHFRFAERNLAYILIRSGCLESIDLGEAGRIIGPKGSWPLNDTDDEPKE